MIKQEDERSTFLSGALALTVSVFVVKLIGYIYKLPLSHVLGDEGMGYFNSAYEIYAMLCVISTAGLPVALSMLVSAHRERGDWTGIRHIRQSAISLFYFEG